MTYRNKLPRSASFEWLWRRRERGEQTRSKNSTGETRKDCMALEKAKRRGEWFKGMPLSRNMYRNMGVWLRPAALSETINPLGCHRRDFKQIWNLEIRPEPGAESFSRHRDEFRALKMTRVRAESQRNLQTETALQVIELGGPNRFRSTTL